jgi:serine/threonine-protein kinase
MANPITRLNAALEGRYRIGSELGEGGMATVYLADDLKHERKVALKVMKPELAAVVGAERFLAEIKTTANLQHPHILPLHDSGEVDGLLFYVMPYVEGETLRERIDREYQLPVEEAISITRAVAGALQHAHERGVIHRDIKPGNILLQDEQPVVADFGIALAVQQAESRLTETGHSLGTPYYMSPEQAAADRIPDSRADIYSLGCVLYEALTGAPPHAGSSAQAVLAKILTEVPRPVTAQRAAIPANVDAALRCALERIPADRFRSAAEFGAALGDPEFRYDVEGAAALPTDRALPGTRFAPIAWAIGTLALLVGLGIGRWVVPSRTDSQPLVRYHHGLSADQHLEYSFGNSLAISRDGARIVYVGPGANGNQLWIRERTQLNSRPLPGTTGAKQPFFSPLGSAVGFISEDNALQVISLDDDRILTLVEAGEVLPWGASWGDDGWVYFDAQGPAGLARVRPTGGTVPEPVHAGSLAEGELAHAWPDPLPGGEGVILTVVRNHENDLVVAMDLGTGEYHALVEGRIARYAESGHLVYVERDGSLLAAPFDAEAMELTGDPVLLQELGGGFTDNIALSATGRLAYGVIPPPIYEVVWVDRDGTERSIDPATPMRGIRFVALSPDDTKLAMNTWLRRPRDDGQLWVKVLPRGPFQQLTFEGEVNFRPSWLPSGRSLAFVSDRAGDRDVWMMPIDGSGDAELVLDSDAVIDEVEISADGNWIVYRRGMQDGGRDLYAFKPGSGEPGTPFVASDFDETSPALSPDGRWLAYVSEAGGQRNVYVRRFPEGDGQWRVSPDGGTGPVWARSGQELFYVNGADSMVVVDVSPGEGFEFGEERGLFPTASYHKEGFHQAYDVTEDGQRFVMIRINETDPPIEDLIVVENFFVELRQRVPN